MKLTRVLTFALLISSIFLCTSASFAKLESILGGMGLPGTNTPALPGSEDDSDTSKDECMSKSTLICNFSPTKGKTVEGYAKYSPKYEDGKCYVQFKAKLSKLEADQDQNIHIHKYGDISSDDGKSTGGHYYGPGTDADHDKMSDDEKKAWYNRGVLSVDSKGNVEMSKVDKTITLEAIVGRGMVIHGGKTPSERVAVCVIGIANPDL